jgi:hypothetical protein
MAWKNADPEERAEIISAIGRSNPAFRRDPERCYIGTLALPFYPGGFVSRVAARDIPGSLLWYVCLPQESVALNSAPNAINHCNTAAPLTLADSAIAAYVKFRYYFTSGARLFESKVKRSAVGYTGKIWLFEKEGFFELDVNISPRGVVTELEKLQLHEVPDFTAGEFDL